MATSYTLHGSRAVNELAAAAVADSKLNTETDTPTASQDAYSSQQNIWLANCTGSTIPEVRELMDLIIHKNVIESRNLQIITSTKPE